MYDVDDANENFEFRAIAISLDKVRRVGNANKISSSELSAIVVIVDRIIDIVVI